MKIATDQRPDERFPWSDPLNAWVIHRYEDVRQVLMEAGVSAAAGSQPVPKADLPTTPDLPAGRQEVISGLKQQMSVITQMMQELGAAHCQQFTSRSSFDLQQELVLPWCHDLAFALLGIAPDTEQRTKLLDCATSVFEITDSTNRKKADAATAELVSVFLDLIQQRREAPIGDFFSSFVDNDLPVGVLLSPVIQLFVGVATSLPMLLGNVWVLLLRYPVLLQQFLDQPEPMLHELIRLTGPTRYVYRVVIADTQIGDRLFKRGDRLAVYLSLANQDEAVYPDPGVVNCTRERRQHMSLGLGAHVCLGSSLIRRAVAVLPGVVIEALGSLELMEVEMGGSRAVKGVVGLRVERVRH